MVRALLLAALVAPAIAAAPADDEAAARLPDLPELRLDLADRSCVIVASPSGKMGEAVAKLSHALEEATGAAPRVLDGTAEPATLGQGPVILLGSMIDNLAITRLYFAAYDFTDAAFPGPEGCVVRTIRDPFGTGGHVLLLGASDAGGVAAAVDWLIAHVRADGPGIGYVNHVQPGPFADRIRSVTDEYLRLAEADWPRVGGSGSWDYMIAIAKAGLGYLRTGDEAYLPVFQREMLYFLEHDVYHPSPEAPQMLHGFVSTILNVWDLLRDHPAFTPDERRRIDEAFLYMARSGEGPRRLASAIKRRVVRDNHGTRSALDAYFLGRFFSRRFQLDEAQAWLDTARAYFEPQMASAKPVCDSWGHQWNSSLFNTVVYAMAAGRNDYFQSEPFRLAAERAIIAHGDTGPSGYLAACAVASGDMSYLALESRPDAIPWEPTPVLPRGDEKMRSFATGKPPRARPALLDVAVAPVDPLWYDTIDTAGFNPGGLYVADVPRPQCFDKISLRESFDPQGYYLLLDGVSGGHHSFQNANCIVWYREGGFTWLPRQDFQFAGGSMSVRNENGVFAALDAEGPGRIHRYSRLLYAGSKPPYHAAAVSLDGVGPVDWERHVLRKSPRNGSGAWTLVVDRLLAHAAGQLSAERYWHVDGEVHSRPGALVSHARVGGGDVYFHLQSEGASADAAPGAGPRVERLFAQAAAGSRVEMAALLSVNRAPDAPDFLLDRAPGAWRVAPRAEGDAALDVVTIVEDGAGSRGLRITSGESTVNLAAAESPGAARPKTDPATAVHRLPVEPEIEPRALPWREILPRGRSQVTAVAAGNGRVAGGTEDGVVFLLDPAGDGQPAERWRARFPSGIHALDVLPREPGQNAPGAAAVVVGEERGAVSRVDASGKVAWTVEIPYVPMAWAYWSEERSRIREIDAADLDGDGRPEILLSNSDRRVYAFSPEGKELWKTPIEWGVFTSMTVGRYGGAWALMGGTSRPSIHGRTIVLGPDGRVRQYLQRPDVVAWSVPSSFLDMRLADLDGDGAEEVVTALDTNCRQLLVYGADGRVKWDADVAGAATCLAVDPARGRVICGCAAGYVVALDGAAGKRLWCCRLGDAPDQVWLDRRGGVVAACRSGRVLQIDPEGKPIGRDDLGTPITALVRPGDHRAHAPPVLGTADGRVLLLPQE